MMVKSTTIGLTPVSVGAEPPVRGMPTGDVAVTVGVPTTEVAATVGVTATMVGVPAIDVGEPLTAVVVVVATAVDVVIAVAIQL